MIGKLPKLFRKEVETVWIHKGNEDFGGGNNNLLIHHERGLEYEKSGFLEEVFCMKQLTHLLIQIIVLQKVGLMHKLQVD